MSSNDAKRQHDETMARIRAEINGDDPREAVIAMLRTEVAAAIARAETAEARIDGWLGLLEAERQRAEAAEQALAAMRRLLDAAGQWQDAGFCPACHADELRINLDPLGMDEGEDGRRITFCRLCNHTIIERVPVLQDGAP